MMVRAGDRIEFLPGGSAYGAGLRFATVVEIISFRQMLQRDAAQRGIAWPIYVEQFASSVARLGDAPVPWCKAEAVDDIPDGWEFGAPWGEFSVVTDEQVPA